MMYRRHSQRGFSLVEVVLAMGVVAFCLLAIVGMMPVTLNTQKTSIQQTTANELLAQVLADLRADVRLPPGQASKEQTSGFNLHGHWAAVATPDTIYFTNDGDQTPAGGVNVTPVPSDAAFRAKITYLFPPTSTTSLADITITWPAQIDPATGVPSGKVETFIAVNR
jgi:prepilin-type N-terminal cleavage/methylation domain-containing protein